MQLYIHQLVGRTLKVQHASAYIQLIFRILKNDDDYVVITSYFSKLEQVAVLLEAQKSGFGRKI